MRPGSWMLLGALFHYREGSAGPPLKNVMQCKHVEIYLIMVFSFLLQFIIFRMTIVASVQR
jgi:hypothetical protein